MKALLFLAAAVLIVAACESPTAPVVEEPVVDAVPCDTVLGPIGHPGPDGAHAPRFWWCRHDRTIGGQL